MSHVPHSGGPLILRRSTGTISLGSVADIDTLLATGRRTPLTRRAEESSHKNEMYYSRTLVPSHFYGRH